MVAELAEIGLRIKGLREACDVSREDMAAELEVPLETYARWEETGDDVPISAIYHMAHHFGVEFTEILTGTAAKLDTYQVVRWGEGREVDRYPGYHFEDLAWRYTGKIMQPLLVVLDPPTSRRSSSHTGQEFSLVIEAPSWSPGPIRSSSSTPATASRFNRSTRMTALRQDVLQNS